MYQSERKITEKFLTIKKKQIWSKIKSKQIINN